MTERTLCPADHKHGATGTCYDHHRCACEPCRLENNKRQNARRKLKGYGLFDDGRTDAEPVRQHILHLREFGIGTRRLAEITGVGRPKIDHVMWGKAVSSNGYYRPAIPAKRVDRAAAEKILAVKPTIDALDPNYIMPARGTQRRLQALVSRGWSNVLLSQKLGMNAHSLGVMLRQGNVIVSTHHRIAALFDELWDQEPPTDTLMRRIVIARMTNYAAARRWLPPLAWDDIDSDEEPPATEHETTVDEIAVELAISGESVRLNHAEKLEAVRRMHPKKWSNELIAEHLGCEERTVNRLRKELGLPGWPQNDVIDRIAA